MAERGSDTTGKKLLSYIGKRSKRVQEKVMQKMGKSEQTKDEVYTEFVVNFNKQQLAASRLNKELERHVKALKNLSQSTKSLLDLWAELYDPDWKGHLEFQDILQQKQLLWNDIHENTVTQVMETMQHYMSKFPETKRRIEKRERKVVDYDASRREVETIRQKQNVNPLKVTQAEDKFHRAKQAFDEIADELYEELPSLFDSRIEFYATLFRNMATIESKFHEEMTKVDIQYAEVMSGLHAEAEKGSYTSRKGRILEDSTALLNPVKSPVEDEDGTSHSEEGEAASIASSQEPSPSLRNEPEQTGSVESEKTALPPSKPPKPSRPPTTLSNEPNSSDETGEVGDAVSAGDGVREPAGDGVREPAGDGAGEPAGDGAGEPAGADTENSVTEEPNKVVPDDKEPVSQEVTEEQSNGGTSGSADDNVSTQPPEVLYKVIATHTYNGEDEDELSFDKGTVILVVPYDDPEDYEDGWQTGVIEETGRKGLFPENFTKRV